MTNRQIFLTHVGQTSPAPLALEIVRAKDSTLYDIHGKEYIDLIGGISVCNVGHGNQKVIDAVIAQATDYMHVMVNGELILSPQTAFAQLIADNLPSSLNSVFFTASGSEATEGAMKLAKRYTRKTNIVAFKNSYHGSTQGSLSIIGSEYWRNAFRPLLPGIQHLNYNRMEDLEFITSDTACVIAETIQSEAGVIAPEEKLVENVFSKGELFVQNISKDKIKAIRCQGLMIAIEFKDFEENKKVIDALIENGIFTDWFLFAADCMRIVPPLTITEEEILEACKRINAVTAAL